MRRSQAVWERLVAFSRDRDDPLAWCSMPRFGSLLQARMSRAHRVPSPVSAQEIGELRDAQTSAEKRSSAAGTGALVGARCLFMARTANHARSQAALHERFGPVARPAAEVRIPYRTARRLSQRAVALAGELIECARAHELELPVGANAIYTRLLRNARLIAYWEALLARTAPAVVVTSVATAPSARAMLIAARAAGIPSVFISHTAVVSVPLLNTLPVDRAGLRGTEEVRHLAEHGVDPARLDVVGNPTIPEDCPPPIDVGSRPVFAAGLEDESRLGPLIDVIRQALGDEVSVGRHPSADAQGQGGEFPARWEVSSGRTYDLLAQGPPALIQHSSGVALEAMQLGIPVIELCYPGKPPLYPLISEPYVRFAADSQELASAVTAAGSDATQPARREALIEWARGWSSPNGREAAERAVALVEAAVAEGPRGPIWEPWETGVSSARSSHPRRAAPAPARGPQ